MWNSDHILIFFFQLSYGNCLLVIYFLVIGEACHISCVEVGVSSVFLTCRSWESNPGCQVWHQGPLLAESSHQPTCVDLKGEN